MLAIRIMQEQGIEVEALNFKTMFTCCQDTSAQAARDLGVRLTVLSTEDDYLDLVKKPEFGYGKGANPCVDCRIYMFELAEKFMQQIDASFIISGEVVGQRPMSQKRRDLDVISHRSGLEDLLLRPLSAQLLPPTKPEREGWVDRSMLYDIQGRSRKRLIELANKYNLKEVPTPSTGCALTEKGFGQKVFDLIQIEDSNATWDYEILKIGRHFRYDEQTKIVMGRDHEENYQLQYYHELPHSRSTAFFDPDDFMGPNAILVGPPTEDAIAFAAGLVLRFANVDDPNTCKVDVRLAERTLPHQATVTPAVADAKTIAVARIGELQKG